MVDSTWAGRSSDAAAAAAGPIAACRCMRPAFNAAYVFSTKSCTSPKAPLTPLPPLETPSDDEPTVALVPLAEGVADVADAPPTGTAPPDGALDCGTARSSGLRVGNDCWEMKYTGTTNYFRL